MKKWGTGIFFALLTVIIGSPAYATHIHYFDYADVSDATIEYKDDPAWTWTCTFDLTTDIMDLYEINSDGTETQIEDGSYNPLYALHYVTLRIDPNNINLDDKSGAEATCTYVKLTINGIDYSQTVDGTENSNWSNPIRLYDWGVPDDPLSDPYGIAANGYKITVTLTGLSTLGDNKTIDITNVNLEGCFDTTTPVPEPASLLLIGMGFLTMAGFTRRFKK